MSGIPFRRARNVCFTLHHYESTDLKPPPFVQYLCYGEELGKEGETPHLQGYAEFTRAVNFSSVKQWLPTAHLEPRYGSQAEAIAYTKKEEGRPWHEHGKFKEQGKRKDLEDVCEAIREGDVSKDIAQKWPTTFVRLHKGIKALITASIEPRCTKPHVIVLHGPTGTGKSHTARVLARGDSERAYWVWTPARGSWFDGYEGELVAIFEEFRGQLPLGDLLTVLDKYECPVQYKGGSIEFVATTIIMTSPTHPRSWYQSVGNDKVDQLLRRIDEVRLLEERYVPPEDV